MATPDEVVKAARQAIPWLKRQIGDHEARLLARCASERDGGEFLEVGTAWGFSAAVMALAAPNARIVTLNPKATEYPYGVKHLEPFGNVVALNVKSVDYLRGYGGPELDMVFVDGDHHYDAVLADAGWMGWLKVGGLLLFHDYTAEGKRRTPEVYAAVNDLAGRLGRELDIVDISPVDLAGMAGFVKRQGDDNKWLT